MDYRSALRFTALVAAAVLAPVVVACSAETVTQGTATDSDAATTPEEEGTTDAGAKPGKDSSTPETKPDAAEAMPTKPFFDVTVNGTAMKVKTVTVKPTNIYPDQGISYYEIKATLEQTPPMLKGLQDDPEIILRVGKDENGSDVCKEKRGPQVGFVSPVTELREVTVHYERFTGSQGVNAFPSTKTSGACTMLLKASAAAGKSWGEAKGNVQAGSDEPPIAFEVKWFQELSWK